MTDLLQAARDAATQAGMRIARKVFEKRGNHAEAHISEGELAGIAGAAYLLGYEAPSIGYESNAIAEASQRPCAYCNGEGRVEMDNNGPIGECPVCKGRLASQRPSYEELVNERNNAEKREYEAIGTLGALRAQNAELVEALRGVIRECDWHRDNGYMQQKAMCAHNVDEARALLARIEESKS